MEEARNRNEGRTEQERENFFWRVKDLSLRKWYIKGIEQRSK